MNDGVGDEFSSLAQFDPFDPTVSTVGTDRSGRNHDLSASNTSYGHGPFEIRRTALNVLPSLPWAAESEILVTNNLRYRETIVQLGNIDILWPDISHLVCLLRRCLRSLDGGKALSLV